MEPVQFIFDNFYGIAGAILSLCIPAFFAYRHTVKVRLADKRQKFGEIIFSVLGDLCNESHYWSQHSYDVFYNSVSSIENAANKLSVSLGFIDKIRLNRAVENYRKCTNHTWNEQAGWSFYPNQRASQKSPLSKNKKSIAGLLKHAK